MPSTFMGLNISYTGLVASNAALNVTSNNIANIETKGYSRQQVNQTAAQAMRAFQSYGCIGAGVDTLGAERVRNLYYDEKYWNNNSKLGEFEKKQYYTGVIETYLNDQKGTNEVKGFTSIFSEYQAAMESLSVNTGENNYALAFIGEAGNLCEYFNILYNNFQSMQSDVNDEIKIKVNELNSIATEIASLTKQINIVEIGGNTIANELRDKRDLLIDDLSMIIDVECHEKKLYDISGNLTGGTEYVVEIAGGQLLVDNYRYRQLECVPRQPWQKVNQNDIDGLYDIVWTDTEMELNLDGTSRLDVSNEAGLYADSVRGQLKGLLEVRDGNNDEAFNGKINVVDTINNTVMIKVTDDYLKDMSKSTIPLTDGRLMLGGEYFYYDSFEFQRFENGDCYYTFKLSEDLNRNPVKITEDKEGQAAKIGERLDYQGIPYYLEQMNEWVRDYASAFNKIYGVEGATDYTGTDRTGAIFFTGNNEAAYTQYKLEVPLDADNFDSTEDGYFSLTAGNFNVEKSIENDSNTLATHTGEVDGVSKYNIINELKDLSTNLDKMKFRGCSAESFLICVMGDSALNGNSANSFMTIYTNIEETILNNRYSISGVDADEEAANMIKYQTAYNLASKMISVLTEVYDRLILETGV